jgi:DNA polymerase
VLEDIPCCARCRLSERRTTVVVGEGDPRARVMLVGEAPGAQEDRTGRPFVGAAGKLLNELLGEAGLRREEVFITNVVKCRPPANRQPLPDELEACRPYLDAQLEAVRPRLVVTLGAVAAKDFLGRPVSMGREHGRLVEHGSLRVFLSFHPAAALYNPKLREVLAEDFALLRRALERRTGRATTLDQFLGQGRRAA